MNHYRFAVKEYFKLKDKKKIYDDLIQKKRLNPLTLQIYINKVIDAKVPNNQLMHYIDTLNILPDFLDPNWPSRKKFIEQSFVENIAIMDHPELKKLLQERAKKQHALETEEGILNILLTF